MASIRRVPVGAVRRLLQLQLHPNRHESPACESSSQSHLLEAVAFESLLSGAGMLTATTMRTHVTWITELVFHLCGSSVHARGRPLEI